MTIWESLKSGKCAVYGQVSAFLSFVFLVLYGIFNIVNLFDVAMVVFSLVAFFFAVVIFFVEVPFCVTCCANQTIQNLVKTFSENRTKSFMYVVMAFIMWLAVWKAATFWSVMTGLLLTATMVFYGAAAFRREDPAQTFKSMDEAKLAAASAAVSRV